MSNEIDTGRPYIYVEPNALPIDKGKKESSTLMLDGNGNTFSKVPDIEDYSMYVNLEMEVKSRYAGTANQANKTFMVSWDGSKSQIDFMEGSKLHFTDKEGKKSINAFTTNYADFSYEDLDNNKSATTSEMFGISSIDIDYTNRYVPQVSINFVDVRGMSLFAPETEAHNLIQNGVDSTKNPNIAGSFFSSFFCFPYPLFRMKVKGYYGKPIVYELNCVDWKATFDCSTGNFGCNAHFIGYDCALLSDITFNMLCISPLTSKGSNYWSSMGGQSFLTADSATNESANSTIQNNISTPVTTIVGETSVDYDNGDPNSGEFVYLNGEPMLTFKEFLNRMKQSAKAASVDPTTIQDNNTNRQLTTDNTSLEKVQNDILDALNTFSEFIIKKYPKNTFEKARDGFIFYCIDSKESILNDKELSQAYGKIRNINNTIKNSTNNLSLKNLIDYSADGYSATSNLSVNDLKLSKHANTCNGYGINANNLLDEIKERIDKNSSTINANTEEVTNRKISLIQSSLGFTPCVQNVLKMICAHMDTLMYLLTDTIDTIDSQNIASPQERSLSNMHIGDSDVPKDQAVPPFPKVTVTSTNNGNKMEDGWLGDVYGETPETNLVEDLLTASKNLSTYIEQNIANNLGDKENTESNTFLSYPVIPSDFLLKDGDKPFFDINLNSSNEDVYGKMLSRYQNIRLVYRLTEVIPDTIGYANEYFSFMKQCGALDAKSFAKIYKDGYSSTFGESLTGSKTIPNFFNYMKKWLKEKGVNTQSELEYAVTSTNKGLYLKNSASNYIKFVHDNDSNFNNIINLASKSGKFRGFNINLSNKTVIQLNNIKGYTNIMDSLSYEEYKDPFKNTFKGGKGVGPVEKGINILLMICLTYMSGDIDKVMFFLKYLLFFSNKQSSNLNEDDKLYDKFSSIIEVRSVFILLLNSLLNYKNGDNGGIQNDLWTAWDMLISNMKISSDGDIHSFEMFKNVVKNDSFLNKKRIELFELVKNKDYNGISDFSAKLVNKKALVIASINYYDGAFWKSFPAHLNNNINEFEQRSMNNYFGGFISELKKLYKTSIPQVTSTNNSNSSNDTSVIVGSIEKMKEAKIAMYLYLKQIYDRWLAGYTAKDIQRWGIENFYGKRFKFIDSFYYKIGDVAIIDATDLYQRILDSLKQQTYMIPEFINDVFQNNNLSFMSVQNFADLSQAETFEKAFSPFPYDSTFSDITPQTDFICLYTYEGSHVAGNNNEYENKDNQAIGDSFIINNDLQSEKLPEIVKSKTTGTGGNGYVMPCFGVSFGAQYQSYFKDIEVNMDSPTVTEQVNKTQFSLGNMGNSTVGERFIGQDLFTIYSNNSYNCTISMMGCGWIQPMMYFVINNIPLFNGTYMITKVNHHIEVGNFITKFTGTRMARTTNPLVKTWCIGADGMLNSSNGVDTTKLADVDNDCQYQHYDPSSMMIGSAEFNKCVNELKPYIDKLANMSQKECGGAKICTALQIVTLLNWKLGNVKGKTWDSVFNGINPGDPHEFDTVATTETKNFVNDIITNNTVLLWAKKSKSLNGNYDILQYIDSWNGESCKGGSNDSLNYKIANSKYVIKEKSSGGLNQIFGSISGRQFWKNTGNNSVNDEEKIYGKPMSKGAIGLWRAIKATCENTNSLAASNITCSPISSTKFLIKYSANGSKIFDMIFQTYFKEFDKLYWYTGRANDVQSEPKEIGVEAPVNSRNALHSSAFFNNKILKPVKLDAVNDNLKKTLQKAINSYGITQVKTSSLMVLSEDLTNLNTNIEPCLSLINPIGAIGGKTIGGAKNSDGFDGVVPCPSFYFPIERVSSLNVMRRAGIYGAPRGNGSHQGLDLATGGHHHAEVYSALAGKVIFSDYCSDNSSAYPMGKTYTIVIKHESSTDGKNHYLYTTYMHLDKSTVSKNVGDNVKAGERIGCTGYYNNGNINHNEHLHFQVQFITKNGFGFKVNTKNPQNYLNVSKYLK